MASIRAWGMASVLERKASARVSLMILMWMSCSGPATPSSVRPWRRRCSSAGRPWITLVRSARLGLALADQTRSVAVFFNASVSGSLAPSRRLATASTSAQVLNRKVRISSRMGMSESRLRISMVYWIVSVSFCSICCATLTALEVFFFSVRKVARNFSNSLSTSWNTRLPVSGYCSITCTTRRISASMAVPEMALASKPSTQEPIRSISRRAGWSSALRNSGSASATRSTGTCRRENHTRTLGGIRSSVRMLWNIRPTTSMVAFSLSVVAFCFSSVERWRTAWDTITSPAGL